MQAFALNIRRDKFRDPRVRRALNFAFDFEEMNKQIFFGQYKRISSYFDGTELASSGLPEGKELEILEAVRAEVPPEVFTKAYTNPVGGNPGSGTRKSARGAAAAEGGGLRGARSQAGRQQDRQRNLRSNCSAQIRASSGSCCFSSLRWSGSALPSACARSIRYSMKTAFVAGISTLSCRHGARSLSPGNEQREYWGSQAADMAGSRNIIGIKNPTIDKLIERVIFTKDREDLVAATKALDRVLLWNHYVVPQWNYPKVRTARWDRFGRPSELPKYGQSGFPDAVVVRRRQGGAERKTVLKGSLRMAQFSRRHVLGLGVGALAAARLRSGAAPTMAPRSCTAFRHSAN